MHFLFNPIGILKSEITKKYLYALVILSIVAGAGVSSESIFSVKEAGYESYTYHESSCSSAPSNLIQEEGFRYIDNSAVESFRITGYKVFRGLLSIANTGSLTSCTNPLLGVLPDPGKFSPYISIYSSLPLRSPPYSLHI
ncbi:MAG TPA: hypothetical protein VHT73_09215 [Thermodesulfobacteriota bacterium]|nr:hypothetical protein [Thermodesulfobacteriota bacterium]